MSATFAEVEGIVVDGHAPSALPASFSALAALSTGSGSDRSGGFGSTYVFRQPANSLSTAAAAGGAASGLSSALASVIAATALQSVQAAQPLLSTRWIAWHVHGRTLTLTELASTYSIADNTLILDLDDDVVSRVEFIEVDIQNSPSHLVMFAATKSGSIIRFEFRHPFAADGARHLSRSILTLLPSQHAAAIAAGAAAHKPAPAYRTSETKFPLPRGQNILRLSCMSDLVVALTTGTHHVYVVPVNPTQASITLTEESSWKALKLFSAQSVPNYSVLDVIAIGRRWVIAVCSDAVLRVWSIRTGTILARHTFHHTTASLAASASIGAGSGINVAAAAAAASAPAGPLLRAMLRITEAEPQRYSQNPTVSLTFLVYFAQREYAQFQLLSFQAKESAGSSVDSKAPPVAAFSFGPSLSFPSLPPTDTLIDSIVLNHMLWALWERRRGGVQIKYWPLTTQSLSASTSSGSSGWIDVVSAQTVRDTAFASDDEPRPVAVAPDAWYLDRVFARGRFSCALLTSAIQRLAHKLGLFPTPMLLQQHSTSAAASASADAASHTPDFGDGSGAQLAEIRREVITVVSRQIEATVRSRDLRTTTVNGVAAAASEHDRLQIEQIADQHWREFLLLCNTLWRGMDAYAGFGASPFPYPVLIKPAGVSVFRSIDGLERVVYSGAAASLLPSAASAGSAAAVTAAASAAAADNVDWAKSADAIRVSNDSAVNVSANQVLACLRFFMRAIATDEFADFNGTFDTDLQQITDANAYITQFFEDSLLSNDAKQRSRNRHIDHTLLVFGANIKRPIAAIRALLRTISIVDGSSAAGSATSTGSGFQSSADSKSSSSLTASQPSAGELQWRAVVHAYRQTVSTRYRLLRQLLVMFVYAAHTRVKFGASGTGEEDSAAALQYIENEAIPRVLSLLKLYRLLHWLGQATQQISMDALKSVQTEADSGIAVVELPVSTSTGAVVPAAAAVLASPIGRSSAAASTSSGVSATASGAFASPLRATTDGATDDLLLRGLYRYFYHSQPHTFSDVPSDVEDFLRFLSIYADDTDASTPATSASASDRLSSPSEYDFCSERQSLRLACFLADRKQWTHLHTFVALSRCAARLPFQHLLGHAFVAQQQFESAKVCFERAATLFDFPRALRDVQSTIPAFRYGRLRYYLDAMQLFESHHQLALSLAVAYSALHALTSLPAADTAAAGAANASSTSTDSGTPPDAALILWSNVFKYSLALYRFDEAYAAMTSLPTASAGAGAAKIDTMRREWLRRLVVVLSGCRQVRTLCRYEWCGMKKEVEEVLWWKARTSELWSIAVTPPITGTPTGTGTGNAAAQQQPNYYEILYAFLIESASYRSAAKYMYHYAVRLERECTDSITINTGRSDAAVPLTRLSHALLAVITALEMVPTHQWLMIEDEQQKASAASVDALSGTAIGADDPFDTRKRASKSTARGDVKSEFGTSDDASGAFMSDFKSAAGSNGAVTGASAGASPALKLVELPHIKRRYSLVCAQLDLIAHSDVVAVASAAASAAGGKRGAAAATGTGAGGNMFSPLHAQTKGFRTIGALSAQDTVLLLLQAGLIDRALSLTLEFGFDVGVVISALLDKCVALQVVTDPTSTVALTIDEHEIDEIDEARVGTGYQHQLNASAHTTAGSGGGASAAAAAGMTSASGRPKVTLAWSLLRSYLVRFDSAATNYRYRLLVAEKLLAANERFPLPVWLLALIKGEDAPPPRNASGGSAGALSFARSGTNVLPLLRLLVRYDMIDEAVHLSLRYLETIRKRRTAQPNIPALSGQRIARVSRIDDTGTQLVIKPEFERVGAATREAEAWIPWEFFDQLCATLSLLYQHNATPQPKQSTAQDLLIQLKNELKLHAA